MNRRNYYIKQYMGAVEFMPHSIRKILAMADLNTIYEAEEIRLRRGYSVSLKVSNGEKKLDTPVITHKDLEFVLDAATGASAYSAKESLRCGYLPVKGGYRIGICGTAIYTNGRVEGFRNISSMSMRIPKEIKGISADIVPQICAGGIKSTLIISPPGYGKTSVLRDIVRTLSLSGYRISIADERCEIAGMWDGVPQMDIGPTADVIDSCPKSEAIMMLLRTMNPQIIAADEITDPSDVLSIENAANCGVKLVATVHGSSMSDIKTKELYSKLLSMSIFEKFVIISKNENDRIYSVYDKGDINA